jgi:hypothetical protein
MFFVHTGRQLKKNRSFADEFVENDSELFCLHEDRDEVKGDRRKYYERKIKDENERRNKIMKKAKLSIPKKKNRETTFFLIIFPDREEIRGEAAERTE